MIKHAIKSDGKISTFTVRAIMLMLEQRNMALKALLQPPLFGLFYTVKHIAIIVGEQGNNCLLCGGEGNWKLTM